MKVSLAIVILIVSLFFISTFFVFQEGYTLHTQYTDKEQDFYIDTIAFLLNPYYNYTTSTLDIPPGPTGSSGATGPRGLDGVNGATGPRGTQGPRGLEGANGASIFDVSNLMLNGDAFLQKKDNIKNSPEPSSAYTTLFT